MMGGVCDLPNERCYHPISCEERGCVKQRSAPKPAPLTTPPGIMSGAVEGVVIDQIMRAVYEDHPMIVISEALATATGEPMGSDIPYDRFIEMGGSQLGLRRSIEVAINAFAALTTPPARSYADGIADAAKVAETASAIGPSNEMWQYGAKYTRQQITDAIRLLSQEPQP